MRLRESGKQQMGVGLLSILRLARLPASAEKIPSFVQLLRKGHIDHKSESVVIDKLFANMQISSLNLPKTSLGAAQILAATGWRLSAEGRPGG